MYVSKALTQLFPYLNKQDAICSMSSLYRHEPGRRWFVSAIIWHESDLVVSVKIWIQFLSKVGRCKEGLCLKVQDTFLPSMPIRLKVIYKCNSRLHDIVPPCVGVSAVRCLDVSHRVILDDIHPREIPVSPRLLFHCHSHLMNQLKTILALFCFAVAALRTVDARCTGANCTEGNLVFLTVDA